LVDGFHRVAAAKQAGITELPFTEKSGTYREALLFSLGVNSIHGLRRSNEDKRKAVMTLLNDEEWSQWSNREIAHRCGVSKHLVNTLRNQISLEFNVNCNQENNQTDSSGINASCSPNKYQDHSSGINASCNSEEYQGYSSGINASCNSEEYQGYSSGINASCNPEKYQDYSSGINASCSNGNNEDNIRTYIKNGVKGEMMVGNIGQSKSSESLPPEEDNQIISEHLKEDEVKEEENTTPYSPLPTPLVTTAELTDSTNVKPTKGKQKITNPLSVGDRIRIKDNHYFGHFRDYHCD
jgi:hypothetical protein